jgi:hypothetical protein
MRPLLKICPTSLVRSDCLAAVGTVAAAAKLAYDAAALASGQAFRGGSGEVKREDQEGRLGEPSTSGYEERALAQEGYPRMPLKSLNLISSVAKHPHGGHSHTRGRQLSLQSHNQSS